jgi:flagellar basal body-associated protein FliL
MPKPDDMRTIIAFISIIFAALAFLIYFAMSMNWLKPAAREKAEKGLDEAVNHTKSIVPVSATELATLVKALATLGESLAKAGPALWSLIGSTLFLLIAAISAGALQGGSTDAGNESASNSAAANVSSPNNATAPHSGNSAAPINENLPVPSKAGR